MRNLISLKWKLGMWLKALFILLQIALTFFTNTEGRVGWMPVCAAFFLVCFADAKDAKIFKLAIIAGLIFWIVYDLPIRNYTVMAFDIFAVVSNAAGIFMIVRNKKNEAAEEN